MIVIFLSVFSDCLQEKGDPRGEIIALWLALESEKVDDAPVLRGCLAQLTEYNQIRVRRLIGFIRDSIKFIWRFWFIAGIEVSGINYFEMVEDLNAFIK